MRKIHGIVYKVKFHHCNSPFTLCDDIEIQNLKHSNTMRVCESLPKFEVSQINRIMK